MGATAQSAIWRADDTGAEPVGNVATEDVLYLLKGLGIETGINLDKLAAVGHFISTSLQRENRSAVGNAMTSKQVE